MAYISQTDVLHHLRIYVRLLNDFLQQRIDEIIELGVFESASASLGQRRPYRERDDNIVWVLLGSVYEPSAEKLTGGEIGRPTLQRARSCLGSIGLLLR